MCLSVVIFGSVIGSVLGAVDVRATEVKRRAAELFEIRNQRMKVDRALHEMGDLGAAVRAELNKLIERRKR